jgi:hypothetical protein
MENTFAILRAIIMTYNKFNVTTYKPFINDGFSSFLYTKEGYILYFSKCNPDALDTLHTPYGKMKVSCNPIENNKQIRDEILTRLKGRFITPTIYVINQSDDISIPYPLIKSSPYTDEDIWKTLYITDSLSRPSKQIYNSEVERLIRTGYIQDDLGILNSILDDTNDANYYKMIDTICHMKLYIENDTIQYINSPRVYNKFVHILGLLLLTDTPIKGLSV